MTRFALLAACALFAVSTVQAQFITLDRPGLTLAAETLPQRTASIEFGVTAAYNSDDDFSVTSYGVPLTARFGLTNAIELRATTSVYDGVRFGGDLSDVFDNDGELGFDFVSIGAKIGLPGDLTSFRLSVTPEVFVPIDDDFDTALGATVAASTTLQSGFSLLGNLGIFGGTDEFFDSVATRLAAQGGYPLTPQVFGFVEAQYTILQDFDNQALLGLGAAFAVTPQFALDASIYAGLSDTTSDILFSLGGSLRL